MSEYWLYVNHPTSKARLHVEGGCLSVSEAVDRIGIGKPFGQWLITPNGYWLGPISSLKEAEMRQRETGKKHQNRCKVCPF